MIDTQNQEVEALYSGHYGGHETSPLLLPKQSSMRSGGQPNGHNGRINNNL